ncbi:MAG: DNA polymerase III subunit beta [Planctomycetota bacterium]|jgi:DNA polymerase-3 subunit beta|nr:MAG: DNA polymerase III subunit beta [Planctomycetota bacterium]
MNLICSRQLLATALATVSGVLPTRTTKEILKNIKLTVADGVATLIGTDQEVGIRYQMPEVKSNSTGEVLLPTQRVTAILRELQDPEVTIDVTDRSLTIKSGQSEFKLSVEDPAEFPEVTAFKEKDYHILVGSVLKQGIQRTIFSTDVESTRYALGGVLMEMRKDSVTLAATDSRRLAVYTAAASAHGSVSEEVVAPVIPAKAMQLIERSIQSGDQEVHIALHANDVLVRSGNSTIYARLVEGRFPRYQDVIPDETTRTISFVVGPFLSAVRQAMIVTNEDSKGVDFSFDSGALTLKSSASDVGTSSIQLPISLEGDDISVTFDPKFVADFLKVLDPSSQVTLKMVDENSAAVFKADDNYTYVVMPLARD